MILPDILKASIEEVIFTLVLTFALVIFVCYVFLQVGAQHWFRR